MRQMTINDPETIKKEMGEKFDYSISPTTIDICKIIPYSLAKGDNNNASLIWLCESSEKELFILSSLLIFESDTEILSADMFPFSTNQKNIQDSCVDLLLRDNLPNYLTNFNCIPNRDKDGKILDFNLLGLRYFRDKKSETKEYTYFRISNELYGSINLIYNCILDSDIAEQEINKATIDGFVGKNNVEIIFVNNIESLISLAPGKKRSSLVSTKFQISYRLPNDDSVKYLYTILASFDIGVKFKKSKFKGNTNDSLKENYLLSPDQYFTEFMFSTHLSDDNKDYIVLRIKNKNNDVKLLFIDNATQLVLKNMISDF